MKPTLTSIAFPADHPRWNKIEFDTNGGCWLWAGHHNPRGYGRFYLGGGNTMQAHRAFWERHKGPIPDGLIVCHKCDVTACVRPDHLFLGTGYENARDMKNKNRSAHGERHPRVKLTEAQVLEVFNDARTMAAIAVQYGVTPQCIFGIKSGKSWTRVTGKTYKRSSRRSSAEVAQSRTQAS